MFKVLCTPVFNTQDTIPFPNLCLNRYRCFGFLMYLSPSQTGLHRRTFRLGLPIQNVILSLLTTRRTVRPGPCTPSHRSTCQGRSGRPVPLTGTWTGVGRRSGSVNQVDGRWVTEVGVHPPTSFPPSHFLKRQVFVRGG